MTPLTDKQRAERWPKKLEAIFETVGFNAEGIRAATGGVPILTKPEQPAVMDDRPRPTCLYCGRRVGHCHPSRRPATGEGAWP